MICVVFSVQCSLLELSMWGQESRSWLGTAARAESRKVEMFESPAEMAEESWRVYL